LANIIKIKEQDEKIEYGGFLDGDFNSNASTQSWGEFFFKSEPTNRYSQITP
jgi:hypothetical protein